MLASSLVPVQHASLAPPAISKHSWEQSSTQTGSHTGEILLLHSRQRYAQPLATQPHFSYTQGIASCNTEPRHIPVQYGTADPQLPHRAQEHPTQRYKIEFFFSDLSPLWGSWLGPPPIIFTRNSFIYLLMQRLPALNLPSRGAGRTLRQFPLETAPRAISQ